MGAQRGLEPRLTGRQREVLERIAEGKTNAEIADELGIGFETAKMHVSHVLAELGVGSREEAAAWWRERRAPVSRMRGVWAALGVAKVASIAVLALAVAGAVAIAVAMTRPGDSGPSLADPTTDTPTGTTAPTSPLPTRPPLPTPIDYQSAVALMHFSLVGFVSDALHTEVVIDARIPPEARGGAGDPVIWVTDATGYKTTYSRGGTFGSTEITGIGAAIPNTPGTVTIEVEPVPSYVAPPLKPGEATPDWAKFTVPSGYTSALRTLPLPAVPEQPLGKAQISVAEVLATDDFLRLRVQAGGLGSSASWDADMLAMELFDASGRRVAGTRQFAQDGEVVLGGPTGRGRGPYTLIVLYQPSLLGCPAPTTPVPLPTQPGGGQAYGCSKPVSSPTPMPITLDDYRRQPGPIVEFQILDP